MGESRPDDLFAELRQLREENSRLKSLLIAHGIPWEQAKGGNIGNQPILLPTHEDGRHLDSTAKVSRFRRLFRGRTDSYPIRWESAKGRSGYTPACGNEWRPGICGKPRIKCGDCGQRSLLPVTDQVIYDHLAGRHTVGVYPLLPDDACFFLAADFDEADWREDALAFMQSCKELQVPAAVEISRSGNGAHVWIFFADAVPAREARRLGSVLISYTCARKRQLELSSYDRLFPNQDTLPKGGFGNLIALPLQKKPREQGRSVFVDERFEPFPDQWLFLASLSPIDAANVQSAIFRAAGGNHPLDVAFVTEEDEVEPWKRSATPSSRITGPLPESLKLVLANQVFVEKANLTQPLANRIIRLAAFQNPEFYKAQAMRLPVWNKPRVIGCAENYPQHIGLPRDCMDALLNLLAQYGITIDLQDERHAGTPINADFKGELRSDQAVAVETMLAQEIGILSAPPAFGKTVTAAALIARRGVSTLVLVHRTDLLRQWQEQLDTFLDVPKGSIGVIGGGKKKPSGKVDLAVMQSLTRSERLSEFLEAYGQIIVDECHHLSAFTFESILKQARARYVVGLSATPTRRDGHHPIIFMQCGPIRHTAARPDTSPTRLEVWPRFLNGSQVAPEATIQDVYESLSNDVDRNRLIAQDIVAAYREGRKIIVLTERTGHLERLREALADDADRCFVLHGRLLKKQRHEILSALADLDESAPRILLATGRLVGEGFDHPPLDTLVLAMPVSWKGTIQQYAGRLHRDHAGKEDVRIYDYIDQDQPQLARMWERRLRGYRAMGYVVRETAAMIEPTLVGGISALEPVTTASATRRESQRRSSDNSS
ncbi:MAG: DEAD/DEAH box helicase [Chloroflexota bacterium]|nr:MAG: DEAD/DEAH box helicase [Chloroflexota bacterium]